MLKSTDRKEITVSRLLDIKSSFTCPNVNSTNEFIVIRTIRTNRVNPIEFEHEKHSTSFDVEIVPKESIATLHMKQQERNNCSSVSPNNVSNYSYGSGGWESTIWTARAIAPAK